jgi:hypothetical protein
MSYEHIKNNFYILKLISEIPAELYIIVKLTPDTFKVSHLCIMFLRK